MPTGKLTCSICRQPIPGGAVYLQCSVSACKLGRDALAFCGRACFDAHLPAARHRQAEPVQLTAPAPRS